MRSVKTLVLGILLVAAAPGLRAQTKPASGNANAPAAPAAAGKVAASPAKPAAKPASAGASAPSKPAATVAATPAKAPAQAATKPAAKAAAKPASKPAAKPAAKAAPKQSGEAGAEAPAGGADTDSKAARRDPFESLVGRQQAQAAAAKNLPPGKAGLQVSTLRLDGIVKAPNGMIAVVSNPQARTYFLREGDQLYDGRVEKIAMDGVSFHELGKDAFGKPVERQVNKRIYSSTPGEQQ